MWNSLITMPLVVKMGCLADRPLLDTPKADLTELR